MASNNVSPGCVVVLLVVASGVVRAQGLLTPAGQPDPTHSDLYAWYAAWQGVNSSATAIDGAPVTRWDDLSNNQRDLVRVPSAGSRQPTFALATASAPSAVEFDGDDYIWANDAAEFGTLAGPKTVFFVARVRSADGGYVFDGTTAAARNAVLTGQSSGPNQWHTFAGASATGPIVDHDVFQVHSVLFGPGQLEHFLNGASIYSGASTIAPLGGLTLGARYTLDHSLIGDIAEVLIYSRALTAAERQQVEGYLLSRYGERSPPQAPVSTDVFVGGAGYPTYRIPALLRTQSGVVLAFAEGRQSLNDHAQNDIVLRRSVDAGQTWSPLQLLHDDGANSLNNPCCVQITTGANAGRVLLMFQRYPAGCHTNCVVPGLTGSNICRSFVMHSDDDGATWSLPVEVTSEVKRPTLARAIASGPGIGIQLRRGAHAGRIVFPFNQLDTSGHWWNYAVFSDDGGVSWSYGALVDDQQTPGQGNEVQFVERTDGSLLLNARSIGGTRHRKTAVSVDGGTTWSPMAEDPKLNDPQVMASVLRFSDPLDGSRSRIAYAGPNSRNSRSNGTVQISYDEGATWAESKMIHVGFYAYSCLAAADDERIGLLYEASGYARIAFAAMTVEWLSDGRDCRGNGAHGSAYGTGCAGSGGFVPTLATFGCPTPGATVTLQIANGLGGAPAVIGIGAGSSTAPLGPCVAAILPLLGTMPMALLHGSGAGNGSHNVPLPLPPNLAPTTLTAQALVVDAGAPGGFTLSNAVELVIF